MKSIIIFGATGLIGAYTAIELKTIGYNVIAVGRRKNDNGFFKANGINYISLDITNKDDFKKLPSSGIFAVLHFAGAMPAHMKGYNPYLYTETIITGTLNILEYSVMSNISKIIFSQSVSDVLYLGGSTVPIKSNSEMRYPLTGDHSVYSISKNTAVSLIKHYEAEYGIKAYILRLPTIYAYHPNKYYYVNGEKKILGYRYLFDLASEGKTIEIWGDPNNKKEFVYIKDFIQLVTCCLISNNAGTYNVGNGYSLEFDEQIKLIINVFSKNGIVSKIKYAPNKPSSPQFILDIEDAKERLGYKPMYDCKKALEAFKLEQEKNRFQLLWGNESDYC